MLSLIDDQKSFLQKGPHLALKRRRHPALEEVLAYENDAVIARYQKEFQLSQIEAELLFDDVKCFLWLNSVSGVIAPPPKIDDGWHIFIIFTQDYMEFCEKAFGVYRHHRPRRPDDPPNDGATARRTLDAIGKHFAGIGLSANWEFPAVEGGGDQCSSDGVSCSPEPSCSGDPSPS